ncbi:MAG: hypothetical protein NTW87_06830 [Planctomycetota bacterium]|nr:hypothetical protein [Planctomycetota bacterium]
MTHADVWLEGWLSGDLPASEMEAFQTWLRSDARNRRLFLSAVALDQDLRAAYRLPRVHRLRLWRSTVAIAGAAAVVLVGVSLMLVWSLLPTGRPASDRVVCGWTLSKELELALDQRPAPGVGAPTITAPQGGKMERVGSLVQLQPGAEVILHGSEPGDATGVIHLATGRSSAPSRAGRLTQLSVETPCGGIVLEQGCKVELTSASFNAPSGEPGQQLDVLVLAGSVMPPDLGPMPVAPQPVKAGTGIRLTKIGQGPVRVEETPTP